MKIALTVLVLALALSACGDPVAQPAAAPPSVVDTTLPPATTAVPETAPVAPEFVIVDVLADVEYYGACGNETVTVGGATWYPLHGEARDLVRGEARPVAEPRGIKGFAAPRVAPPGPGDDIGTLIVYGDGIARFESESGWIIWLTDVEQTYGWEC